MALKQLRVRFAPSPTGLLHIGSVRTALFNWLFARHHKGKFILRIEDTDLRRSNSQLLDSILEDLKWLGLDWDEGPYFQSQRLDLYRHWVQLLLKKKAAYYCFCTPEELVSRGAEAFKKKKSHGYDGRCRDIDQRLLSQYEKEGKKKVVRFRVPEGVTRVNDLIRGEVKFDNRLLDDFIIMKSDGMPVYNFAVVVDDHLMNITHVLRGEEHLSNTPRQLLIYQALELQPPLFGHLPIILDEQRRKLSKREGATFLREYRAMGFIPEALLNFLALLGWSPKDGRELLSISELITEFSIKGISSSPAVFNLEKLRWMNSQHIKLKENRELLSLLWPYFQKAGYIGNEKCEYHYEYFYKLIEIYKERITTFSQFIEDVRYCFQEKIEFDPQAAERFLQGDGVWELLDEFSAILESCPFVEDALEEALRSFAMKKNIKAANIIHPLRVVLTGKAASPGIFEVMSLLGKERTIARIKWAKEFFAGK